MFCSVLQCEAFPRLRHCVDEVCASECNIRSSPRITVCYIALQCAAVCCSVKHLQDSTTVSLKCMPWSAILGLVRELQCVAVCCKHGENVSFNCEKSVEKWDILFSMFLENHPLSWNRYRVATIHRKLNLRKSFSAKELHTQWLICGKWLTR